MAFYRTEAALITLYRASRLRSCLLLLLATLCSSSTSLAQTKIQANQVNLGVSYVGGATLTSGDIGAQINSAITAFAATGGKVIVLPNLTGPGTCYTWTTAIKATTAGKPIVIEGATTGSNATGDVNQQVCLNWTSTSAGAAMTLGWTPTGGGGYVAAGGLRNLILENNGCTTGGGCSSSATGVATSGGGVHMALIENVKIEGFGTGWQFNDNGVGWGVQFHQFSLSYNTTGMLFSVAEEGIRWIGGALGGNGTGITSFQPITDLYLNDVSLDSNITLGVNNGGFFQCVACHFENLSAASTQFITSGGTVVITGGEVINDNATGTTAQFFTITTGFFSANGLAITSPSQTVTNILTNTAGGAGDVNVTTSSSANVTSLCSVPASCSGQLLIGTQPPKQIPFLAMPEGSAVTGKVGFTNCAPNASTHVLECSFNNDTRSQVTRFSNMGNVYNASGVQATSPHVVIDSGALNGASPAILRGTLTGSSVFTSSSSYKCTVTNNTTVANALKIALSSGSAFTITGPNGATDTVTYMCIGD